MNFRHKLLRLLSEMGGFTPIFGIRKADARETTRTWHNNEADDGIFPVQASPLTMKDATPSLEAPSLDAPKPEVYGEEASAS